MTRLFLAVLIVAIVPRVRSATAQTLDELQRPLLAAHAATVQMDYGQFAFESASVGVEFPAFTYFDPPYYSVVPGVSFGISRKVQVNVSGAWLPPILRSETIGANAASILQSHWLVKSVRADMVARPSEQLEIGATYFTGRSRYDGAFRNGNGTTTNERVTTDGLQIRGVWLPRPDRESRRLRADLDGLTGPLLRRHRTIVTWDAAWRRYGSTLTEGLGADEYTDDAHSTDTRVRTGAGWGATERLQLNADAYWQPSFSVDNSVFVHDAVVGEVHTRVDDRSRHFSGVFGGRASARWRPAARLEAFGDMTYEHQSVRQGAVTGVDGRDNFQQAGFTSGVTWLSRSPDASAPWLANLSGLYRPLLEPRQLRLDAVVRARQEQVNGQQTRGTLWRTRATMGVWSALQASVYAGRFDFGDQLLEHGTSFGGELRFRPTGKIEAYGALNYHPMTAFGRYPAFLLSRGSIFRAFLDLTDTAYEDDASIHVGVRLLL
jgi:hypothetical protein